MRNVLALLLVVAGPAVASGVPDPTRPAVPAASVDAAPGTPAPSLVLQSTMVSGDQRSAIINGAFVRPGDTLGEARVVAIGPGWVRLEGASGPTELRLSYSSIARPVNR
ncbi:MAG: hypothetical protein ACK5S2_05735 [Lysobacteraceae bacterium]|nr:hypothetical protein [Xanthomonadaceae bacterium]MCZ8317604.1 hypothetical protein [Silanimonas sp.]